MKFSFLLLFLSGINVLFCSAQSGVASYSKNSASTPAKESPVVERFQQQLAGAIQMVTPACVLITTEERLTPNGGVMASGVVVSADGIVMTAGHMVVPGGKYKIVFPDSTRVEATGLGKIGSLDAGLLKITEPGVYPHAKLGASSSLKIGEPCFSLAYPGSFATKLVIRFGQVIEIRDDPNGDIRTRHIRTSCLMEPGDSGGPLFDLSGQVIGIRSYIGMPLDENYEVPVDIYKRYWEALQTPVNYRKVPDEDLIGPKQQEAVNMYSLWPEMENQMQALEKELDSYCAVVRSTGNDSTEIALGAIVDVGGLTANKESLKYSYVVSKSSEVSSDPEVMINSKASTAKVVFRDADKDLILLQLDAKSVHAIAMNALVGDRSVEEPLGALLISPNPLNEGERSIFGTASFKLPGVYNSGYLGMRLEMRNGKNVITSVQLNTAASRAMLSPGDEILDIDRVKVESPADFSKELKKKKAHDVISLVRYRNGSQDTVNVKLQGRPFRGINHIADDFTDGRSERRDDFDKVFIHDAKLKPSECGGPIFDLHKKFLGVNMARYSRTSSIGMSAQEVYEFLKTALTVSLSGKGI